MDDRPSVQRDSQSRASPEPKAFPIRLLDHFGQFHLGQFQRKLPREGFEGHVKAIANRVSKKQTIVKRRDPFSGAAQILRHEQANFPVEQLTKSRDFGDQQMHHYAITCAKPDNTSGNVKPSDEFTRPIPISGDH